MYAAQWMARLSFLSKALILAPLERSSLTIWNKSKYFHGDSEELFINMPGFNFII